MKRLLAYLSRRFVGADCPDEWQARVAHSDSIVRRAQNALALNDAKAQEVAESYRTADERLRRR
jgi:hypothetical protein